MDVTITQFRRDIFGLVKKALDGAEVCVSYKGELIKLQPVTKPKSKLDRLTPMDVINEDVPEGLLLEEMTRDWEEDWKDI